MPGSREVYRAPWAAVTLPRMTNEVPAARLRSCRTARGRAWLLTVTSAVASAAATAIVKAAAMITSR